MSKTTVFSTYVTGGKRTIGSDGVARRQRRGAVVAVVDGAVLRVGWSLCNYKSGDRFNPEIATNLAEGRARAQHKNSLKFGKNQVPTFSELIQSGIPQSVLSAMSDVITRALTSSNEVRFVQLFNAQDKPTTTSVPKPLWTLASK